MAAPAYGISVSQGANISFVRYILFNNLRYLIMANITYDNIWHDALGELGEQLHIEGVDDLGEEVPTRSSSVSFPCYYRSILI